MSNNAIGDNLKFSFEKVHLSCIRFCTKIDKHLSELGEYPLTLKIFNVIFKNWLRVLHMNPESLLYDWFIYNAENIHRAYRGNPMANTYQGYVMQFRLPNNMGKYWFRPTHKCMYRLYAKIIYLKYIGPTDVGL